MALQENRYHLLEQPARAALAGIDAQGTGEFLGPMADRIQCVVQLPKQRRQTLQQLFPGLRHGHAAGGAVQQANPQALFEPLDCVTERGARYPEGIGGLLEAALLSDLNEGLEIGEAGVTHW